MAGIVILKSRNKKTSWVFISVWLAFWILFGTFVFGSIFSQYYSNKRALKLGKYQITEGVISQFHHQDHRIKGDSERFVVSGKNFSYSNENLGGAAMRSSKGFDPPLQNGLYVRIYHRQAIIIRIEAKQK